MPKASTNKIFFALFSFFILISSTLLHLSSILFLSTFSSLSFLLLCSSSSHLSLFSLLLCSLSCFLLLFWSSTTCNSNIYLCKFNNIMLFSITCFNNLIASSLSYAHPPVWKLHPHSDIISKLCKPAFHSSYLSHNMFYGGAATIQIFCLPQWRYSYST